MSDCDAAAKIHECLIAAAPELAAKLAASIAPPAQSVPDWMQDLDSGELLTTLDAAEICGVQPEAIRKRCQDLEELGTPIGRCVSGKIWLVSKRLLLADIEQRKGEHGRLVAESRAEKMPKVGLAQEIRLSK
ncbi:MAG: hypothetical protein ABSA90_04250 [Xanthobacteraceae bacterium]|jgi:hypothetical protein